MGGGEQGCLMGEAHWRFGRRDTQERVVEAQKAPDFSASGNRNPAAVVCSLLASSLLSSFFFFSPPTLFLFSPFTLLFSSLLFSPSLLLLFLLLLSSLRKISYISYTPPHTPPHPGAAGSESFTRWAQIYRYSLPSRPSLVSPQLHPIPAQFSLNSC